MESTAVERVRPDPGAAARLERARGVLRRVEDRAVGVRPVVGAAGTPSAREALGVPGPLARLLPGAGLRRGSIVSLRGPGGTSLLFGLLAEVSAAGGWTGVVGRPELGLVAAAEAGVALERLALVPRPGAEFVAVTAALLDGFDLVAVVPGRSATGVGRAAETPRAARGISAPQRAQLAARARQRGAVLVALGPWAGADVELVCATPRWYGADAGSGRLRARRIEVRSTGRGLPPSGRRAGLLLPAPGGAVALGPAAAPPDLTDQRRVAR